MSQKKEGNKSSSSAVQLEKNTGDQATLNPPPIGLNKGNMDRSSLINNQHNNSTDPKPIQRVKEDEFNNDPSAFMDTNQVLVSFEEGVKLTYELGDMEQASILERQRQLGEEAAQRPGVDAARYTSEEALGLANDRYLDRLTDAVLAAGTCDLFTLAMRKSSNGWLSSSTKQYIVTPYLEGVLRTINEDETVTGPDGITPISLKEALRSLIRKPGQEFDNLIHAAYIPYESDPNSALRDAEQNKADLPLGELRQELKLAFTPGMNGCALAVKRKSENEISVWHFPSPDTHNDQFATFQERQQTTDSFRFNEYNDEQADQSTFHATSTILIRDEGGWNVKSQQSRGPRLKGELGARMGKVFERRLEIGGEEEVIIA